MADKTVRARYVGGTDIVMPHLEQAGGPHAGEKRVRLPDGEAIFVPIQADVPQGGVVEVPDCRAFVVTGDVILIDHASADGREDFEIVGKKPESDDEPAKPGPLKKES